MKKKKEIELYLIKQFRKCNLLDNINRHAKLKHLDGFKNLNGTVPFYHPTSKTIILIGLSNNEWKVLKLVNPSWNIFSINKKNYKKSWKTQQTKILDSILTSEQERIISKQHQERVTGGLKQEESDQFIDQIDYISPKISNDQIDNTTNSTLQNDLIGKSPGWLLNSGMGLIGIVSLIFLAFSFIIKYPDKITTQGILYSNNPPISHVMPTDGIIDNIHFSNGDTIQEGVQILSIKNNVDLLDFDIYSRFIQQIDVTKGYDFFKSTDFPIGLNLGSLASSYSSLQALYLSLQSQLTQQETSNKISVLKKEILKNKELNQVIENERNILQKELKLLEKNYERYLQLNQDGNVSTVETENELKKILQLQKEINRTSKDYIQNNIEADQKLFEIENLSEIRTKTLEQTKRQIFQTITQIQEEITSWKKKYLLASQIEGEIQLKSHIHEGVSVTKNTELFSIIPTQSENVFAKIQVASNGIGKIDEGDQVILKFHAYPYKEFGFVEAVIRSISILPEIVEGQYFYQIEVGLNATITTNTGFEIPKKAFTEFTAEIITKDYSLIRRIAQNSSKILK